MASPGTIEEYGQVENRLWLEWLVRLRWVAIVAQIVTVSFSFGVLWSPWLAVALLTIPLILGLSNLVAMRILASHEEIPQDTLLAQLAMDILALTTFFALCGGPHNSFTLLYVIHVAMGAVMLTTGRAAAVTAGVLACYASIHLWHLPLHLDRHTLPPEQLIQLGQIVSFAITVLSVSVFVVGLATTLRRRKKSLLEAQARTARTDRLRSVGTLAAGAAHELNTPLSTLGLRVRRIARRHDDPDTTADLEVIRGQLERCKGIVDQLLIGAGDPSAGNILRAPLADFVREAVKLWSKGTTLDVTVADRSEGAQVELPKVAFSQALINLLENAREAQEEAIVHDPLEIEVFVEQGRKGPQGVVLVRDHGAGLPEEPDRVGEPFFTTKKTGTGLGVFVARAVADGAGGGLLLTSAQGATVARWWFPLPARSPA